MSKKQTDKVVFLIEKDTGDAFAYFPEIEWSEGYQASYAHVGQHGACSEEYALHDCRPPKTEAERNAAELLKAELERNYDYRLEVLDAAKWQRSTRAKRANRKAA